MNQFGIMLNYGHRISAVVVGALLLYVERVANNELEDSKAVVRVMLKTAGIIYFINIILGGLYVVTAVDGVFLGWLSLLHLLVGVCVFLTLATTYLLINISKPEVRNVSN